MKIVIEQRDINESGRNGIGDPATYPIARAVKRQTGFPVSVITESVKVANGALYLMDQAGTDFVNNFDRRQPVFPCTVEATLIDSWPVFREPEAEA